MAQAAPTNVKDTSFFCTKEKEAINYLTMLLGGLGKQSPEPLPINRVPLEFLFIWSKLLIK